MEISGSQPEMSSNNQSPHPQIIPKPKAVEANDFKSIIDNFQGYSGKDMRLRGKLGSDRFVSFNPAVNDALKPILGPDNTRYFLEDSKGYRIYLTRPLPLEYQKTYEINDQYVADGKLIRVAEYITLSVNELEKT